MLVGLHVGSVTPINCRFVFCIHVVYVKPQQQHVGRLRYVEAICIYTDILDINICIIHVGVCPCCFCQTS